MVTSATKDWKGGFREQFDIAWTAQRTGLSGCELDLEGLASALEDVWDTVIAENTTRADTRAAYDSWQEQLQAGTPD